MFFGTEIKDIKYSDVIVNKVKYGYEIRLSYRNESEIVIEVDDSVLEELQSQIDKVNKGE